MNDRIIHTYLSNQIHSYNEEKRNELVPSQTKIFEVGLIDSISFVLLVEDIQENFKIKIYPSEMINNNFESIQSLISFIKSKMKNDE